MTADLHMIIGLMLVIIFWLTIIGSPVMVQHFSVRGRWMIFGVYMATDVALNVYWIFR